MTAGWRIEFTQPARRDFKRLDPPIRQRVAAALRALVADPPVGQLVKLQGTDEHRLRVGDWRVRVRLAPDERTVCYHFRVRKNQLACALRRSHGLIASPAASRPPISSSDRLFRHQRGAHERRQARLRRSRRSRGPGRARPAAVETCDNGIGGADPALGSRLIGLSDRVEALGGTLEVTSPAGNGTTLLIEIPHDAESSTGSLRP